MGVARTREEASEPLFSRSPCSRMIREFFLQQNAFSEADAYCDLNKSSSIMETILTFYEESRKLLDQGITLARVLELPVREDIGRLREVPNENYPQHKDDVLNGMRQSMAELASATKGN